MSNTTTLRIQNPPQYDVTIESDLKESIFLDMYRGAAHNVVSIIERNEKFFKNQERSSFETTDSAETINTTIAFVGGRGTGKSSAMQSFSNYLQQDSFKRDYAWLGDGKSLTISTSRDLETKLKSTRFVALPTIDSSQISKKETVVGRMSATMIAEYRKQQKRLSLEQKQEFLNCAKEVNELAVLLQTGDWFKCGDKLLTDTERICSMRSSVRKLVDTYLSIVCKDAYLIISIDDLDMSINSAHAIMEEIRQYLSIPRVVVLVSIDETLLDAVIRASIGNSLKASNSDDAHNMLIEDLSYRYLEKLFPVNRRHHTPRLTGEQLREWKSEGIVDENALKAIDTEAPLSVRDAILHLIWRKTMLIPVCNQDGDHLLIPRNLRSLCHMVVLLRNLPDIAYEDGHKSELKNYKDFLKEDEGPQLREDLRYNLDVFEKYIVNNISSYGAPQLSTKNEADMAKVLENVIRQMQEVPLNRMNAMIVGDILYYIEQIAEKHDTYKQILNEVVTGEKSHYNILSPAIKYPDSISLGDVMYVLGKLDSRSKCAYIRYLVEVIRILWSIRMTEEFYVNSTSKKVRVENLEYVVTKDFRCTVGGTFVNPDYLTDFVENGGWIEHDKISNFTNEVLRLLTLYQGANDPRKDSWREARSDGGPYYNSEKYNPRNKFWYNPFAMYAQLLSKKLFSNHKVNNWQNEYIMALPFYSFDFMYRYYEEIHKTFRTQSDVPNFLGTIRLICRSQETVRNLIEKYIPKEAKDNIINSLNKISSILLDMITSLEVLIEELKNKVEKYSKGEMLANDVIDEIKKAKDCKETIDADFTDQLKKMEENWNLLITNKESLFGEENPSAEKLLARQESCKEFLDKLNQDISSYKKHNENIE